MAQHLSISSDAHFRYPHLSHFSSENGAAPLRRSFMHILYSIIFKYLIQFKIKISNWKTEKKTLFCDLQGLQHCKNKIVGPDMS